MKAAVLLLLAICHLSFGAYYNDDIELERLRKFLYRQLAAPEPLCSAPVDIVFVMDRSRSIWGPNFELEKKFVQDIVKMFDPKMSRFGVITWAEGADVMIKFGVHGNDQASLISDIGKITQRPEIGGSTETWAALRLLREQVLTPRNRREGAKPIAVLITDGASQKKQLTKDEAAAVHQAGITVFAIGIKEVDMDETELKAIASDPDADHEFKLDNWEEAARRMREIGSKVCPPSPNIDGCKHNYPLDLVFSVSGWASASQTTNTFTLIKSVISNVTLGPGHVQVGLAPRVCVDKWNAIALNAYDEKSALDQALDARLLKVGNELGERFTYLADKAFISSNGGQSGSDVVRVAVIVLDQKDEISSVVAQARSLQRDGVKLIFITVGDVQTRDVGDFADSVMHVSSYREMASLKKQLLNSLCNAQKFSASN